MSDQTDFFWKCQPEADRLLRHGVREAIERSAWLRDVSHQLERHTSTRLFDWIDHIVLPASDEVREQVERAGFVELQEGGWRHSGAQLPRLFLGSEYGIALSVDSIPHFLMQHGCPRTIEGAPYGLFRRSQVVQENGVTLWVVERRGTLCLEPTLHRESHLERWIEWRERWLTRPRRVPLEEEERVLAEAIEMVEAMVGDLGRDPAACLVLECERDYWQGRNHAARMQKSRQDQMGMGWANHDHHTFRSSRHLFLPLVHLFELLGFSCRERFYAGKEAGWGAQVMENPIAGLILFLDVDLTPEEISLDFAHQPLEDLQALGTIGLWCGLHGDSILGAGMHHLEGQFLFDRLGEEMERMGVGMMEPFSNFSYLKQAFTNGERWQVESARIEHLLNKGSITHEQAQTFLQHGAIGSHLENLQREEGFKGFNQKNVSYIIAHTDPRTLKA